MKFPYNHPSFYAHVLSGFLLFIAVILVIYNYKSVMEINPVHLIMLILLFSTVVGIHGISHLGLEKNYGFDPINFIEYKKYIQQKQDQQ